MRRFIGYVLDMRQMKADSKCTPHMNVKDGHFSNVRSVITFGNK